MTALIILAAAIFFDFILNGGDALANIFKAIGTIFYKPQTPSNYNPESEKLEFIQTLKDEIDELYNDLSYENSTFEDNLIKEQIKYKQTLIEKLMNG